MDALVAHPFTALIILLVGFYILMKGADALVLGASAVAHKLGISPLVVGLTVVAFGTSAPELFVNITSSIKGTSGITLGNVIGSNLANVLLGIGIIAIIRQVDIKRNTAWREIPFLVLATLLMWTSASDFLLDNESEAFISRSEAIMLFALFIIFLVYTFGISKVDDKQEGEKVKQMATWKASLFFFAGLLGLIIGGQFVVEGAVSIAENLGMSEALIGITIIAIGTSVPDIITSIVAAYRNQMGIAIGNLIGSNIFNILLVLSVSSMIRPIPVGYEIQFDLLFTLGISVLLFLVFQLYRWEGREKARLSDVVRRFAKQHRIHRWEGILFVALYIGYITYSVMRG